MTVIDRQSSPALPSPNVSAVLLDRSGSLWLALERDGVRAVARWRRRSLDVQPRAPTAPSGIDEVPASRIL